MKPNKKKKMLMEVETRKKRKDSCRARFGRIADVVPGKLSFSKSREDQVSVCLSLAVGAVAVVFSCTVYLFTMWEGSLSNFTLLFSIPFLCHGKKVYANLVLLDRHITGQAVASASVMRESHKTIQWTIREPEELA